MYFRILGNRFVVLNNASLVLDFLDKKSVNTCDRQPNPAFEL